MNFETASGEINLARRAASAFCGTRLPDNPPLAVKKGSVSMDAATGNHVVLRLDSAHYAVCAHLQPGSIAVKVGERVKIGHALGRLGNSSSSDLPHLHFHMVDSDSSIFADGVPYILKSFEWRGAFV